jgi:hypothetical protein
MCGYSMTVHRPMIDTENKPFGLCPTSVGKPRLEDVPKSAEADRA